MLVARHVGRRLLILSVSTLGFFISSFSAVLALDFTAPVVSVLDGDTIGTNVNHMLVKDGWCWWYRKYASADIMLERLEREA